MSITDWFEFFPGPLDNGIKMLICLVIIFAILTAFFTWLATRAYKKDKGPSILDMDFETDIPAPTDIPPSERIAILKIEKAKFVAGQKALSDAQKRKEISESIFGRLSVRYASDVKKIDDEIEKTTREVEVSQLEEELKKMQGDYLSKIKGDEEIRTPASIPSAAPPAPPIAEKKQKVKKVKTKGKVVVPPTPPASTPSMTPPTPPMTSSQATPPPPPGVSAPPPPQAVPAPPTPQAVPRAPTQPPGSPSIPAPSMPAPKPPGAVSPPSAAPSGEGEGDLFAKSTSIAALRKEMLKELDRLKKFMSEQQ